MSTFYGRVLGNRSEATRGGSRASGFMCSAQSWDGSVITRLWYDNNDALQVRIGTADGSSCCSGYGFPEFNGSIEELRECFRMWNEAKKTEKEED